MFKSKIEYITSIMTLTAFSIISVSVPKLIKYYKTELPHKQKISQIQKCSSEYQYNKLLEDLVTSKDFKIYFENEDFLAVYKKFRVDKPQINLDYHINSTFSLSFFKDDYFKNSSRQTKELIENLENKRKELNKN